MTFFVLSIFVPKLTLNEAIDIEGSQNVLIPSVGESLISGLLHNVNVKNVKYDLGVVKGEEVTIEDSSISAYKIVSMLGARIVEKQELSSVIILNLYTKLLPYRNKFDEFNAQMKVYHNKIIVASPKFLN